MAMHGAYREVSPPGSRTGGGPIARLVRTETFDFGCQPQAGEQVATMTFTERNGRTTITISVMYPSKEARDGALASGMEKGMSAGYDQLENLLASGAMA